MEELYYIINVRLLGIYTKLFNSTSIQENRTLVCGLSFLIMVRKSYLKMLSSLNINS